MSPSSRAEETLSAARAFELGLINHVVPDGQAVAKARDSWRERRRILLETTRV